MAYQRKELPSKYYLDHFNEFLAFVGGPCKHLLDENDESFISTFRDLNEDAMCLLVRTTNRKSPYIPRHTLYYEEIENTDLQFELLYEAGLLREITPDDIPSLFVDLTKPQLAQCLKAAGIPYKSSSPKTALLELAAQGLSFEHVIQTENFQNTVVRNYDNVLDYMLFLFFGDVSSRLNKFSMRDLGVMQTRKGEQAHTARFASLSEAKSTFFYRKTLRQISMFTVGQCLDLYEQLNDFPEPDGNNAQSARDKLLLQLGMKLHGVYLDKAMDAWSLSGHPDAQAKWIRGLYKAGKKEQVLEQLNIIIDNPASEQLLVFAEDFLARKFNKKRTSQLTDMLRENSAKLNVDEIYRDSVEAGVICLYETQGHLAWHTENQLWRTLFGLFFWQELFETDKNALATEFDLWPRTLKANDFYQQFSSEIEARLAACETPKDLIKQLTTSIASHYGKGNGIFWWSQDCFERVCTLVEHGSFEAIKNQLRAISKDYKTFRDGYPDLMVLENGQLRFEEIKGPGDQLRRNQLLTINQLRKAGFDIRITQVEWFMDPLQPYVVVDIETTGGAGNYDRITEIGMVKMVGGEEIESWQSLINPQRRIPGHITRLTGIDNEMVADAPLFNEIADDIRRFMQGCVFVAHNVNFDYGFIKAEFERLEQAFKMPKLCTVREMRKAVPGLKSYSLANLTERFDITMARHHRALSDAQAAAELLQIINKHRLSNQ